MDYMTELPPQSSQLIAFLQHAAHCLCNGNEQLLPETVFPDEPDAGLIQHVKTADERTEQQQEKRYAVSQLQKETETEQNGGNPGNDTGAGQQA